MSILHAASVLFAEEPESIAAVERCLRELPEGGVALDSDALGEASPELLLRLQHFWQESQAVLRDHLGGVGGRPFAVVRRVLVEHVQKDDTSGRSDLAHVLEAADTVSLLDWVLDGMCSTNPAYPDILRRASVWSAQLEQDGVRSVLTLEIPSTKGWPAVLGGSQGTRELKRRITIETNHAKWRDRRVRRLMRVLVEADELWADPTA
jgi:hypothetical protein